MIRQRTLRNAIKATGVGLHTGEKVYLTLCPAPLNTGIVFLRVDLKPLVEIPGRADNVADTTLSTSLLANGETGSTVEHLMAAMSGLGIDNAYVDVSAPLRARPQLSPPTQARSISLFPRSCAGSQNDRQRRERLPVAARQPL